MSRLFRHTVQDEYVVAEKGSSIPFNFPDPILKNIAFVSVSGRERAIPSSAVL